MTTSVNSRRPKAPGDATVRNAFSAITSFFFCRRSNRIAFLKSVNFSTCDYMHIFNFSDGHVITFRHFSGAYICRMPGYRLSRLAKGTPSESRWRSYSGVIQCYRPFHQLQLSFLKKYPVGSRRPLWPGVPRQPPYLVLIVMPSDQTSSIAYRMPIYPLPRQLVINRPRGWADVALNACK